MRIKSALKSAYKSRKAPKTASSKTPRPTSTKLDKGTLEQMLKNTYEPTDQTGNVGGYVEDKSLSNKLVRVYNDPTTKHTVVAHRGSQEGQDWKENLLYAIGFRGGKNYRGARTVQRAAETKYGVDNLTTVGHSKGALHAQDFGQKGEIMTLDKPVNIRDAIRYKVPKYQTDYRGESDVVSILRPLQRGNKAITLTKNKQPKTTMDYLRKIKKVARNPFGAVLDEHSIDALSKRNEIVK
jgi:hypothetical protein